MLVYSSIRDISCGRDVFWSPWSSGPTSESERGSPGLCDHTSSTASCIGALRHLFAFTMRFPRTNSVSIFFFWRNTCLVSAFQSIHQCLVNPRHSQYTRSPREEQSSPCAAILMRTPNHSLLTLFQLVAHHRCNTLHHICNGNCYRFLGLSVIEVARESNRVITSLNLNA